ncbi:NAD-binding protein [Pigmentiphaga litoralis]|uniref:3-hydroxyisobutyrate dehydrogenase-like beta-hydroxyacid dehydrogenase n=1 Tax=Pigmentiphaga litoralis TaxID=516702 RepID=A0A7Y9IUE8_9BURK|nr:NAD-binding protein [Pigmentiphaga litoralis]NYE23144.1 3-hydroxyisobutyrate dehydrogenase-like beta-hydroxyacid dehydrogenase [Pigmentiphaga litoralis]NYE83241.1 3-hydroxyisobutyrate dehydrogenase-like beta-hydroxyacid dehydrogenase [Pigmentiphaga litoralis]
MTVANDTTGPVGQPIGFIGLGAMGGPMVGHLLRSGVSVVVHDLNLVAVRTAEQAGAQVGRHAQDVAARTGLVFVCLPSLGALRAVLLGDEGIARCGRDCTVVDLSTTGPAFAREMRAELEPLRIAYIDAPITGNVTTAGNGKLGVMCSGAADAFARAEPVMRVMAETTVLYLGDGSGRAQTLKLLNNLVSATGMAVTSEAFVIAAKAGVRPGALLQVLNAGEASTNASRNKFATSVLPRRFNYGARMAITAKDISFAVAEAERLDVPVWIARPAQQLWRFAASQGGADRDGSSLITYLEPWAGVEVKDEAMADARLFASASTAATPPPACQVWCEPDRADALRNRLAGIGWDVAIVNEVQHPGNRTNPDARCLIRCIPPETNRADLLDALADPMLIASHPIILNTCWMSPLDAEQCAAQARDRGCAWLDAPLSGRLRDLEDGSGSVIVSSARNDAFCAQSLLQALGRDVYLVSSTPGDAQRVRYLEEAVSATLLAVACESYVIGARAGLAADMIPRILGIETGRTLASGTLFPQQVLTRRFDHGRSLGASLRALQCVSEECTEHGISAWVLDSARLLYGIAVAEFGADADVTHLVRLYEQWTGVEVRPGANLETST